MFATSFLRLNLFLPRYGNPNFFTFCALSSEMSTDVTFNGFNPIRVTIFLAQVMRIVAFATRTIKSIFMPDDLVAGEAQRRRRHVRRQPANRDRQNPQ